MFPYILLVVFNFLRHTPFIYSITCWYRCVARRNFIAWNFIYSSTPSVFGSNNTNVFGGKTTFGQPSTTVASIFGGGSTFAEKPTASSFWSGANATTGPGFGSSAFGNSIYINLCIIILFTSATSFAWN